MKTNHLTPDLLRRYAAGTLTPAEQHAVERLLLDDPLAAEAAEGLARLRKDGVDADAATAEVRARLRQRVANRQGRVIPLAWTRYAAAAVVLVGVAGLGWWALREEPTISRTETTRSATAPPVAETAPLALPAPAPSPEAAKAPAVSTPPQAAAKRSAQSPPEPFADADEVTSPPVASSARVTVAPPADTGQAEVPPAEIAAQSAQAERLREVPLPAAAPRPSPAVASRSLAGPRFTGRVLGVNQQPVAGATVTSVTTRQSVRTDDLGKFALPETPAGDRLRIAALGYQPLEVAVRDTAVGTLNLQPAPNAPTKAVAPGASRQANVYPEKRFAAFDDFVRAHRRVAGQGTVRLSFRLGPGGRPRQVRVEASDNPALNGEAIRLMREGPRWDETKPMRRKGRVVYAVRFE